MRQMYTDKTPNQYILDSNIAFFSVEPSFSNDVDYVEAVIPHHSITILTSGRTQIEDPRVRALTREIG